MSAEVNNTYPDDNYDGAILKFFEGDCRNVSKNCKEYRACRGQEKIYGKEK